MSPTPGVERAHATSGTPPDVVVVRAAGALGPPRWCPTEAQPTQTSTSGLAARERARQRRYRARHSATWRPSSSGSRLCARRHVGQRAWPRCAHATRHARQNVWPQRISTGRRGDPRHTEHASSWRGSVIRIKKKFAPRVSFSAGPCGGSGGTGGSRGGRPRRGRSRRRRTSTHGGSGADGAGSASVFGGVTADAAALVVGRRSLVR
mmetsp:Transcript_7996/g.33004  ORF Transcript_7996/g.33004 Transcript_7996/m.33004 type:complete len:207 (-) Transcript_7996:3-623(-)